MVHTERIQDILAMVTAQAGVLYVKGKPGMGKTAMFEQIAQDQGWQYVDLRLSQIDETEVLGLPRETKYRNEQVFSYLPPKWAVRANEAPTLVVFEELNRAPITVRNAALQILNERRLGDLHLSKTVYLVAVGNLGEADGCEVEEFDNALNNRLIHYVFEPTFEEWKSAFGEANVNKSIISFLSTNGQFFHRPSNETDALYSGAFPSPRTWTFLSALIGKDSKPETFIDKVKRLGAGYIGSAVTPFIRYCEDLMSVSIDDIIKRWDDVKDKVKDFNRDRRSELLTSLLEKNLFSIASSESGKKHLDNIQGFFSLLDSDELMAFFKNFLLGTKEIPAEEVNKKLGENETFRVWLRDNYATHINKLIGKA
jgi:hypothetical protein